jgi:hypothetical protein
MHRWLDHAATDAYLEQLIDRIGAVVGDGLVGAYLVNSGARDDYLPGRSDLDVAVIVTDVLDAASKHRLADRLRHRSLPCPAPRLELVVYRREVVEAPGDRPAFELNLNTGPAIPDHLSTDPAGEPPHWFVLDLAAASETVRTLVGSEGATVFGRVPAAAVIGALQASQAWHARHDTAAPNRVLNDCRAWHWLTTGRWSSKSEAAAWAMTAGGDRSLIEHALALRSGTRTDPLPPEEVAGFADRIGREIDRAANRLGS